MPDYLFLKKCPYYNNDTYGMPAISKEQFCKGDYCWSGRYLATKAEERNMPTPNPYPEILVDETSGVKVPDERHRIWDEGYEVGQHDLIAYEVGQHDLIAQIGRAKIVKEFPRLFK